MRGAWLGVVLAVGCAGRGEAAAPEPEPERMRFGMCVGYAARSTERHPAFERGEELFDLAAADYAAGRDEAAARGYLAAGAAFHEAAATGLAVARANQRVAHANAALAWLMAGRVDEARAALALAATRDEPAMQDRWQREIAGLPGAPGCSFPLARGEAGRDDVGRGGAGRGGVGDQRRLADAGLRGWRVSQAATAVASGL